MKSDRLAQVVLATTFKMMIHLAKILSSMEINLQVIDGRGTFRPQNAREPTVVLKYEGGAGKEYLLTLFLNNWKISLLFECVHG